MSIPTFKSSKKNVSTLVHLALSFALLTTPVIK